MPARFTGKRITEWHGFLYDFSDGWCKDVTLKRVVSTTPSNGFG
jgi:hypothetical protein